MTRATANNDMSLSAGLDKLFEKQRRARERASKKKGPKAGWAEGPQTGGSSSGADNQRPCLASSSGKVSNQLDETGPPVLSAQRGSQQSATRMSTSRSAMSVLSTSRSAMSIQPAQTRPTAAAVTESGGTWTDRRRQSEEFHDFKPETRVKRKSLSQKGPLSMPKETARCRSLLHVSVGTGTLPYQATQPINPVRYVHSSSLLGQGPEMQQLFASKMSNADATKLPRS